MWRLLDTYCCILKTTKKLKEDNNMKTTTIRKASLPYPNAATRHQVMNKVLDLLLMAAIGAAVAAMLLFLLALA